MSNQSLRWVALACKIWAIFVSVVIPLFILHPRWGLNHIADVQLVGLAVVSLIPNRWLVFSRISFVIFLLLTLSPFREFFHVSAYKDVDWGLVMGGTFMAIFLFGPLPLSLVLSRVRLRRGEKFTYA